VNKKLFENSFVQFANLWFHSSLKQNSQPELSLFCAFHSKQFITVSFKFLLTGTHPNSCLYIRMSHIWFTSDWWLLLLLYLNILPVSLLFIQESFQVLESVVQKNKKIQIQGVNECLLFFFTGYQKSLAVGIRGTWQFLHNSRTSATTPQEEAKVESKIIIIIIN